MPICPQCGTSAPTTDVEITGQPSRCSVCAATTAPPKEIGRKDVRSATWEALLGALFLAIGIAGFWMRDPYSTDDPMADRDHMQLALGRYGIPLLGLAALVHGLYRLKRERERPEGG